MVPWKTAATTLDVPAGATQTGIPKAKSIKLITDLAQSKSVKQVTASAKKVAKPVGTVARKIDRWGEKQKHHPKTVFGGVWTLIFSALLIFYSVRLYITCREEPPKTEVRIGWSYARGPYPLPLVCYVDLCLVSANFEAEATGMSSKCVGKLPASQRGQCIQLRKGERVVIRNCFSQLLRQGVHVHFAGVPAWHELKPPVGLNNVSVGKLFGVAVDSDMEGMNGIGIMSVLTPLRTGVSQLKYVETKNQTLPAGDPGSLRHEWFSTHVASDMLGAEFANDPCSRNIAAGAFKNSTGAHTVYKSVFKMDADFTEIGVTKPKFLWLSFAGEVGGALELLDIFFGVAILFMMWLSRHVAEISKSWCWRKHEEPELDLEQVAASQDRDSFPTITRTCL